MSGYHVEILIDSKWSSRYYFDNMLKDQIFGSMGIQKLYSIYKIYIYYKSIHLPMAINYTYFDSSVLPFSLKHFLKKANKNSDIMINFKRTWSSLTCWYRWWSSACIHRSLSARHNFVFETKINNLLCLIAKYNQK